MKLNIKDFFITLFSPMILGKTLIIYFGMNYTNHPGRGYGIGLAISILFTLVMIIRFLWKYRHYKSD
jgi:hypothetical protein